MSDLDPPTYPESFRLASTRKQSAAALASVAESVADPILRAALLAAAEHAKRPNRGGGNGGSAKRSRPFPFADLGETWNPSTDSYMANRAHLAPNCHSRGYVNGLRLDAPHMGPAAALDSSARLEGSARARAADWRPNLTGRAFAGAYRPTSQNPLDGKQARRADTFDRCIRANGIGAPGPDNADGWASWLVWRGRILAEHRAAARARLASALVASGAPELARLIGGGK